MSADNQSNDDRIGLDNVLADYLDRVDRGESVDQESLVRAHPDLADELREFFAHEKVVRSPLMAETENFQGQLTPQNVLQVRCPHCHTPTAVAVDTALVDMTCPGCGSVYSITGDSSQTRSATTMSQVGHFELIERIGVGGFGSVWKARDTELDRAVAVKIPRRGEMSAEETEKFLREARAAAQLKHPNIVSVHEIGRDGETVYIVSDLVRGITLDDWLTAQQPTNREAAELCVKIAEALHHAHEKGVIHRDLKPGNIMLDGDGEPHLMDFGLARREAGEVTMTLEGHVLGTPAYMSPEQAEGESHQADCRSDIYSLGVILFRLLTGELPFRGNARMLMHQMIHDEPPSPRTLNSNIPRDLETITLKCLEKQPTLRYDSAQQLASELRRYLAGKPIEARPIGRVKRAVRWSMRNKTVAMLSAIAIAALVGGTASSTLFAINARRQAEVAQAREAETVAILEFVEDKILAAARPQGMEGGLGHDVTLRQAIEAALPYVESDFAQQPLIEARLRQTLGELFLDLGESKSAADQFVAARNLFTRQLGPDHPDTLTSMSNLAGSYNDLGRDVEALELRKEILVMRKAKLGPNHPDTLSSMSIQGASYAYLGRNAEALQLLEETLVMQKAKLGPDHNETFKSMHRLANVYANLGRDVEALELREEILVMRKAKLVMQKAKLGPDHPETFMSMHLLANIYANLGRDVEALELREEILVMQKAKLGPDHPDRFAGMYNLVESYANFGRDAEALQLLEETLTLGKAKLGPDHPNTLWVMRDLVRSYTDLGRNAEALKLATEMCELTDFKNQKFIDTLAFAYAGTEDFDSAVKWSEKAMELLDNADDPQWKSHSRSLAIYQAKQRQPVESRQEFTNPPVSHLRTLIGHEQIVEFRVQWIGGYNHRYLNSKNCHRADCFTAVVEPGAIVAFDSQFTNSPQELIGKIVRVTGTIEARNGQIQIRITDILSQLQLVAVPEPEKSE